jgi:YD repeat-containing protein
LKQSLSHYWDFEDRPLNGDVQRVEIGREFQRPGGAGTEVRRQTTRVFRTLPDGGREATVGPERAPNATITYDAKGRITRIVSTYNVGTTSGRPSTKVTSTETATYDQAGRLTAIEIKKNNEAAQTVRFEQSPASDGGWSVSWDAPGGGWTYSMTYNAKGRPVRFVQTQKATGKSRPAVTFTYNEQGDVIAYGAAPGGEQYEYEYDAAGNWVRRQRFSLIGGKREPHEVEVRKIEYGAPSAVAKADGATRPSAAATARADAPPDAAKVSGRYQSTRGAAGSGLFVEMTLVLNADHTAEYGVVTELRGQRTTKTATGSWAGDGAALSVRLDKASDGQPLPQQMRNLRFGRTAAGDLIPDHDPKTTFRRVSQEK